MDFVTVHFQVLDEPSLKKLRQSRFEIERPVSDIRPSTLENIWINWNLKKKMEKAAGFER